MRTPTYSAVCRLRLNALVGLHRPCKQDLSGVHKQQHSCRPSFLCQLQPQNNATERGRTPQNTARERTWRTSFLPLLPAPRYPTTLPHTALPSMPSCALPVSVSPAPERVGLASQPLHLNIGPLRSVHGPAYCTLHTLLLPLYMCTESAPRARATPLPPNLLPPLRDHSTSSTARRTTT